MKRTMNLSITYTLGGAHEKEIVYEGGTLEEIAKQITDDENQLLYYMRTGDDEGERCFYFGGFMFRKDGLLMAQMTEGVI